MNCVPFYLADVYDSPEYREWHPDDDDIEKFTDDEDPSLSPEERNPGLL